MALAIVVTGLVFALWSLAVRSPHSPRYVARWERVSGSLERMEFVSDSEVNVLMFRFRPDDFTLALETDGDARRVKAWARAFPTAVLVINGFYFLEDESPAGLLIDQGTRRGKTEFDWDKSGMVTLAPNFSILDTSQVKFTASGVLEAGQSYPFLLRAGEGAVETDSGLSARRTFIGTDTDGMIYLGVIWKDDVTLFELVQTLQETGHEADIIWQDVINLDGGPSTGIAVEAEGFSEILDSAAAVPNVITLTPI